MTGAPPADGVLATHPFVTAIPFFFPTLIIIAVIGIVVWRDRRAGPSTEDASHDGPGAGETPAPPSDDRAAPERP